MACQPEIDPKPKLRGRATTGASFFIKPGLNVSKIKPLHGYFAELANYAGDWKTKSWHLISFCEDKLPTVRMSCIKKILQ